MDLMAEPAAVTLDWVADARADYRGHKSRVESDGKLLLRMVCKSAGVVRPGDKLFGMLVNGRVVATDKNTGAPLGVAVAERGVAALTDRAFDGYAWLRCG